MNYFLRILWIILSTFYELMSRRLQCTFRTIRTTQKGLDDQRERVHINSLESPYPEAELQEVQPVPSASSDGESETSVAVDYRTLTGSAQKTGRKGSAAAAAAPVADQTGMVAFDQMPGIARK